MPLGVLWQWSFSIYHLSAVHLQAGNSIWNLNFDNFNKKQIFYFANGTNLATLFHGITSTCSNLFNSNTCPIVTCSVATSPNFPSSDLSNRLMATARPSHPLPSSLEKHTRKRCPIVGTLSGVHRFLHQLNALSMHNNKQTTTSWIFSPISILAWQCLVLAGSFAQVEITEKTAIETLLLAVLDASL